MRPPIQILRELEARGQVTNHPCRKSHRRVVIYDRRSLRVAGTGVNAPPCPLSCDGSPECRRDCSKICIHAEAMAINNALRVAAQLLADHDLVHGKFVDGKLVAGGGPSCWQCSKQILEVGIGNVWLYELAPLAALDPGGAQINVGQWRSYNAFEFHQATLKACELKDNLR